MSRKTMEDRMEKIEDIQPTAELSPEMIKTICNAISQEFYSWEINSRRNDNVIEIDSQLYECVAILGMRMGRDDVTELINDMLYYRMRREQGEEE
jgi:hypothetical protein